MNLSLSNLLLARIGKIMTIVNNMLILKKTTSCSVHHENMPV